MTVEADVNQFETALVNLVANARDAMDGQGELRIGVSEGRFEGARSGEAAVLISVSDTGCGIAADQIEKIFEPFFTTKQIGQGTGLGLSQVYGFAKQSGGLVTVTSAPGAGAQFTLILPRSAKPLPAETAGADSKAASPPGQGCILIVEDNPEVGDFTSRLLDDLGYQAVLARTGDQALVLLEANPDRFKLIFSDVMMPGISGIALGKEVRRRFPGVPFLLTSGYQRGAGERWFARLRCPA